MIQTIERIPKMGGLSDRLNKVELEHAHATLNSLFKALKIFFRQYYDELFLQKKKISLEQQKMFISYEAQPFQNESVQTFWKETKPSQVEAEKTSMAFFPRSRSIIKESVSDNPLFWYCRKLKKQLENEFAAKTIDNDALDAAKKVWIQLHAYRYLAFHYFQLSHQDEKELLFYGGASCRIAVMSIDLYGKQKDAKAALNELTQARIGPGLGPFAKTKELEFITGFMRDVGNEEFSVDATQNH